MRNFAEYLSEYVAKRHLSWRKAAQLCQVDRTLLSRYAAGKKLPESMDKAVRIGKGLKMSLQQIEGLKAAYQVSRMGKYQYQALKSIGRLFGGQGMQGESALPAEESGLLAVKSQKAGQDIFIPPSGRIRKMLQERGNLPCYCPACPGIFVPAAADGCGSGGQPFAPDPYASKRGMPDCAYVHPQPWGEGRV